MTFNYFSFYWKQWITEVFMFQCVSYISIIFMESTNIWSNLYFLIKGRVNLKEKGTVRDEKRRENKCTIAWSPLQKTPTPMMHSSQIHRLLYFDQRAVDTEMDHDEQKNELHRRKVRIIGRVQYRSNCLVTPIFKILKQLPTLSLSVWSSVAWLSLFPEE